MPSSTWHRKTLLLRPARWTKPVSTVESRVAERKFNSVPHLFNLVIQAPNVLVRYIGSFRGEELLNVRAHDSFKRVAGAKIRQDSVSRLQVSVAQRTRKCQHSFGAAVNPSQDSVIAEEFEDGP